MTSDEQLILLRQGATTWNKWREENQNVIIDLSSTELRGVDISKANLSGIYLCNADLRDANLSNSNLQRSSLNGADISNANLSNTDLRDTDLRRANLHQANLSGSNLGNTDLRSADIRYANLSWANLHSAQVLCAVFDGATLTGACIADWQIGSSTNLDNVICDYIYRTIDEIGQFAGRLPVDSKSIFIPGEFTQRFQLLASAQETIDITFTEGIDWQAFFSSFQQLRVQHSDANVSIQGMERKSEGFVIRLEVNKEADKATIETQAKQLYAEQLQLLETQYEERLRLQGAHLEDIRALLSCERRERTRLSKVVETMAHEQQAPKYDMRGSQFAGGFAETIQGNQAGGTIQTFNSPVGNVAGTNTGSMTAYINQNSDDISRLLTALRETAQQFPEAQKDEALMELDDLEADLKAPEKQEPKRIGKRLQRLMAAGSAAATIAGGAATFSGDINEFTGNVLELAEKVGLARDGVQP